MKQNAAMNEAKRPHVFLFINASEKTNEKSRTARRGRCGFKTRYVFLT